MIRRSALSAGYTFIELLVVFSIIGVVSALGIASFVNFSNTQSVEGAASDVVALVTTARQRSLSQIKPEDCAANESLRAYRVRISSLSGSYGLEAVCGDRLVSISSKQLPPQVRFSSETPQVISFSVPNATVEQKAVAQITGFGKTKTITIDGTGSISVK